MTDQNGEQRWMTRYEVQEAFDETDNIFNPYLCKAGDLDTARVSVDLPKTHHQLLKQISADNGLFQRAFAMFLYALVDDCQQNQISYYTPLNQKKLYDTVKRRCALTELAGDGRKSNVTKRAKKAPAKTKVSGSKRSKSEGSD